MQTNSKPTSLSSLLRTNTKLAKSTPATSRFLIAGLTFSPHRLSGNDVCFESTIGCRASCNLWYSGQRVTPQARRRAKLDTQWYFTDRPGFLRQLRHDIDRHIRLAKRDGLQPLVRLNVASDLDWMDTIASYPDCTFYDYTKIRSRFKRYLAGRLPPNYSITFSASETSHPSTLRSYLQRGGNVAMVLDVPYHPQSGTIGAIPKRIKIHGRYFRTIDGDKHDVCLPSIDGRGVIRALRLKGTNAAKSRARASGFAYSVN